MTGRKRKDIQPLLDQVSRVIADFPQARGELAATVGVAPATLDRWIARKCLPGTLAMTALADSLLRWTPPEARSGKKVSPRPPGTRGNDAPLAAPTGVRQHPLRVVDLFSGCGGLSLGLELCESALGFETVLAIDSEAAAIRVLNANRASSAPGRQVDITQFRSRAEILAFYLDHHEQFRPDPDLRATLDGLPSGGLSAFLDSVHRLDQEYHSDLRRLRAESTYREAVNGVPPGTFAQTSVEACFRRLGIPLVGLRWVEHPLLWSRTFTHRDDKRYRARPPGTHRMRAVPSGMVGREWDLEVQRLSGRRRHASAGPAGTAASKIKAFLDFLHSPAGRELCGIWTRWHTERIRQRGQVFEHPQSLGRLQQAYVDGPRVALVLGGPPCQGFSRVGRGKIRSLRDAGAHAEQHDDAGDERNLLLQSYAQFVGALQPDAIVFENVASFRSRVRAVAGDFDPVSALRAAFNDLAEEGQHYHLAMRDIECSEHGVPQARRRFFMAGVRWAPDDSAGGARTAALCISPPRAEGPLPLRVALDGLPSAHLTECGRRGSEPLAVRVPVAAPRSECLASATYSRWIQLDPRTGVGVDGDAWTDAHVARRPRTDDEAWFALMGPGARWMDYRADGTRTLRAISEVLGMLRRLLRTIHVKTQPLGPLVREIRSLSADARSLIDGGVDGALTLRLLLERLSPDPRSGQHHLLRSVYLSKKSGGHGDWMMRLDPSKPSRTIVSHMAKDAYAYVHPAEPRTLSVREAARIQTFPDAFSFSGVGMFHALRMIGNAVPPLLSGHLAPGIAAAISASRQHRGAMRDDAGRSACSESRHRVSQVS